MRKADVSAKSLQAIADADGFASLAIDRRQALWAARGLARHRLHDMPLFAHAGRRHERLAGNEPVIELPQAELGEKVAEDYRNLGLSLKAHPSICWQSRLVWLDGSFAAMSKMHLTGNGFALLVW